MPGAPPTLPPAAARRGARRAASAAPAHRSRPPSTRRGRASMSSPTCSTSTSSLRGGDAAARGPAAVPAAQDEPDSPPVRLLDDGRRHRRQSLAVGLARGGWRRRARRTSRCSRAARSEYRLAPGSRRAARAAHLDGRAGRRGHQDLRLPAAAATRSTSRYDVDERVAAPLESRVVRAVRAPHVFAEALDVRRRELRLPRPGDLRRQEVPRSSTSTTRTTRSSHAVDRGRLDGGDAAPLRVGGGAAGTARPIEFTAAREGDALAGRLSRAAEERAGRARTATFNETLFVGPKLQDQLKTAGPKLEPRRRLRQAHDPCAAALLAAASRCTSSSATGASRSSS